MIMHVMHLPDMFHPRYSTLLDSILMKDFLAEVTFVDLERRDDSSVSH
jgi:hypothetical protein